jgi:hypothetical protein
MSRCPKTAPVPATPAGLTIEVGRTHPRYAHLFEPGARCELDAGHEDRHKNGLLYWNDPPVLFVGGVRVA